jgi:hypothetical protein
MGAWLTRKVCRRMSDIIRKGLAPAAREVLFILLEMRIRMECRLKGRMFSSLDMLKLSIFYSEEIAMPVVETAGPLNPRQPLPPPASAGNSALKRFGTLAAPRLEWNAEVERETVHLYERIRNVVPSVGRSLRPMCARSTR